MTELSLSEQTDLDRYVADQTAAIRDLLGRAAEDLVEIGTRLAGVKERLEHGQFVAWCEGEFAMSPRMARRFMNVADRFKTDNLANLNIGASALYLLAAPSTPDDVVETVMERARAGEAITHSTAREALDDHRAAGDALTQRLADRLHNNGGGVGRYVPPVDHEQPCVSCGEYRPEPEMWQIAEVWYCDDCYREVQQVNDDTPARPHVANNSGNQEWFTPPEIIEAARQVMGRIDLDPASCAAANEIVQADAYFDVESDGLSQPWYGGHVFLNPPYSQPAVSQFADKLVASLHPLGDVSEAIVLVNNATETDWFQLLLAHASAVCFPQARIRFIDEHGERRGSPLQGQALLYFGPKHHAFTEVFREFGAILAPVQQW